MTDNEYRAIERVIDLVRRELIRATRLHGPFRSPHEGFGVLYEEVDELWDEVKRNNPTEACWEAVQVAAMAARFILDLSNARDDTKADPTSDGG